MRRIPKEVSDMKRNDWRFIVSILEILIGAALLVLGLTVLAWVITTFVYQAGSAVLLSKNPIEISVVIGVILLALIWAFFQIAHKFQGKGGCGCSSCGGCCGCSGRKKD